MSYSHTQRRKRIKSLKKQLGDKWYPEYQKFVERLEKERLGPCLGSIEDILLIHSLPIGVIGIPPMGVIGSSITKVPKFHKEI